MDNPFYQLTAPTLVDGQQMQGLRVTSRGELLVVLSQGGTGQVINATPTPADAFSNTSVNAQRAQAFNMHFNGSTWDRMRKPSQSARLVSAAATTNAAVAKASAGDLYLIRGHNAGAAMRFLKLYNKATAPTVGTDIPVMTIPLPAGASFDVDLAGHFFSAGIAYAITQLAADNDTTALVAGDVVGLLLTFA